MVLAGMGKGWESAERSGDEVLHLCDLLRPTAMILYLKFVLILVKQFFHIVQMFGCNSTSH